MITRAIALLAVCACIDAQLQFEKTTSDNRRSNFQQPGYLPPEEPAPAQIDPVIIATTQSSGPTHHGRDLCTDPFHSFLCQKLKPRKPFTGGSPLQGANSFVAPSKVLAPPINDVITTTQPPTTTTLKPSTTTRRPTTTTTRRPTTTTTTKRPTTTTTTTTTEKPVTFDSSNDVRSYLPPENLAPAAAAVDPAILKPEEHSHHHDDHHHHHHRDICTDPFHSFLCVKLKPRKRITGDLPNHLQGANSFLSPKKIKPEPEPPVAPAPSNVDRTYLRPEVSSQPPPPQAAETKEIKYSYPKPVIPQPTQNIGYTYPKPDNKLTLPTENKEVVGYSYPTPDNRLTLPTERKEVIGYSYPKPDNRLTLPTERKEVVGYSYQKPDNRLTLPTENKETLGYSYPKPAPKFEIPTQPRTLPLYTPSAAYKPISSYTNSIPTAAKSIQKSQSSPSSLNNIQSNLKTNKVADQNVETIHGVSSQSSSADFIPVNKPVFGERLKRRNKQQIKF